MILKKLILSLVFIAIPLMGLLSPVAYAANNCSNTFFGIPTWYQYLPKSQQNSDCTYKFKDINNAFSLVILGLIDIALFFAGFLAVVMIIWGGYEFIFSNGSPDQIAKARKTILNAVIGLVIAIFAAQIVRFIASKLSG